MKDLIAFVIIAIMVIFGIDIILLIENKINRK